MESLITSVKIIWSVNMKINLEENKQVIIISEVLQRWTKSSILLSEWKLWFNTLTELTYLSIQIKTLLVGFSKKDYSTNKIRKIFKKQMRLPDFL